jgi:hypothetical protein
LQSSCRSPKPYKPRAIRTTTLLILVILSCGLIASLDVTRWILSSRHVSLSTNPHTSFDSSKRQLSDAPMGTSSFFDPSNLSSSLLPPVHTVSGSPTSGASRSMIYQQTDGSAMSSTSAANFYLTMDHGSSVRSSVQPSESRQLVGAGAAAGYLQLDESSKLDPIKFQDSTSQLATLVYGRSSSAKPSGLGAPAPSVYIQLSTASLVLGIPSPTLTGHAAPSMYIQLSSASSVLGNPPPSSTYSPAHSDYVQLSTTSPVPGSASQSTYLITGQLGFHQGFTGTDYFIGAYLPTLVTLIYAGFWGMIDANVRRMEPFYQLSRPNGAFAKDTLTFSYFDCNTFTAPFHALYRRHWAVFCSSIAFLIASAVLPPVAASTLVVGVSPSCSNVDQKGCTGILVFRPHLAWVLHGGLVLNILMAACLILLLRKRKMGVARDPSSIVGLATTFKDHPVMDHLQAIEGGASMKSVRAFLGKRRYYLFAQSEVRTSSVEGSRKPNYSESAFVLTSAAPNKPESRPRNRNLPSVVVGILLLGLIAFLVYYHQNKANNAFERFMDGQSIGVRAMMVMIGVVIKIFWQKTEQSELEQGCDHWKC